MGHDQWSQDKGENRLRITGRCCMGLVERSGLCETGLLLAIQDSQHSIKWLSPGHPREQLVCHGPVEGRAVPPTTSGPDPITWGKLDTGESRTQR